MKISIKYIKIIANISEATELNIIVI